MMRKLCTILVLALWAASAAKADPDAILVCYPGGPVNARDANSAMASMLRVVERVGQWAEGSFTSSFTTRVDDCRRQMEENKPKFAITSLGLYLEMRSAHHLIPLVQPKIKGKTGERYRVVAAKGKYHSLDDLKGKSLGGTVLEEPVFLGKIVFAGKYDPASFFVLKPSNQPIRTLRALDKGELDAAVLNEQQYAGLDALALANPLEAVFTSEEIPLMGLAADGEATTAEERARLAQALEGMCADAEGKKLCDLFGVESFNRVDPGVFAPVIQLWGEGK